MKAAVANIDRGGRRRRIVPGERVSLSFGAGCRRGADAMSDGRAIRDSTAGIAAP